MATLEAQYTSAIDVLAAISMDAVDYGTLPDDSLLALARLNGDVQRSARAHAALIAGEVARRSTPELGHAGLAQSTGYRTTEELLCSTTGSTARDASQAVRVGRLALGDDERSWLTSVGSAVVAERLSIASAESIINGLGAPSMAVPADELAAAAVVGGLYDRATSPRRGGPRFAPSDNADLAERILDDKRSTEQLASDVFAELLRQGSAADSSQLLSTGAPSIRVLVTKNALESGLGAGHIEGQTDPISLASVERLACCGAITEIDVHNNQPLNLGREQRLYSRRQRIALAARDGGCRVGNCSRPPAWCEAHHILPWQNGGKTHIADGILLCRHHHLLFHNNGWQITRDGNNDYWLIPPVDIDPLQTPRPMPSKSRAFEELKLEQASA